MNKYKKIIIIEICIIIALCILIIFIAPTALDNIGWFESSTVSNSEPTGQQAKHIFNSMFERYEGEKVKAGEVKVLVNDVILNNDKQSASEDGCKGPKQVGITTVGVLQKDIKDQYITSEISKIISQIDQEKTYRVEMIYGNSGLIIEIIITKNKEINANNTL